MIKQYSINAQGNIILFANVTVAMFGIDSESDRILFDTDLIPVFNSLILKLKEYNFENPLFHVSSGYRTNEESAHGQGKAMDFSIIVNGANIDNKYVICALNDIAEAGTFQQFSRSVGAIGNVDGVNSPNPMPSNVKVGYYTHCAVNYNFWWGIEYDGADVGSIFNEPWNCNNWYDFPWIGGSPGPTPTPTPSGRKRKNVIFIPNINNKYLGFFR